MSETKTPRRTVMFIGHHQKPITEDLVKDLLRAFRPGSVSDVTNEPATEKDDEAQLVVWRSYKAPMNVRFYYPKPLRPGEKWREGTIEVVVNVRTFPKVQLDNLHCITIPLYEREKDQWFEVIAGRTRIEDESPFDMAWFFEKVHRAFPIFRPDFGYADTRTNALTKMGDDPRRRAGPVLLYGPAMVAQLGGRERVLESPVYHAEELPDGSLWLQVVENPFKATEGQLKKVATYLGLAQA